MIERIITGDLGVNTYLYNYSNKNIVIFDPGSEPEKIIETISNNSYIPKCILLTHGHFDHIGAVKELSEHYGIPVHIHKGDASFLGKDGINRHREMFQSMGPSGMFYFETYYTENKNADFILNDNEYLEEYDLKVIHTPGHSEGSSCFYSQKDSVIFTGDTMFKGGMGRTDFSGGDYNKLLESLNKLKQLPKETKVYPGHGDFSTIDKER